MKSRLFFLLCFCLIHVRLTAQIRLPRLVSNGMVLQRDQVVRLWGWASPNEEVKLTFKGKTYSTKATQAGSWQLELPAQQAGGPYELVFSASNEVKVSNVLFGDVWLCSGQSNMELPLERVRDTYASLLAKINFPQIRQFEVTDTYNFKEPNSDVVGGKWIEATSPSLYQFSAAAFFFALEIYQKHHVPIGLINSALGGSPAEAWISEERLQAFPSALAEGERFKRQALIDSIETAEKALSTAWYKQLNQTDIGLQRDWKHELETDWKLIEMPAYFPENTNGSFWLRKEIIVPKSMVGKPAKLLLGRIVDADSVFVNGRFVGSVSYQYPPRRYLLANDVLKEGKNTVVVRLISNSGQAGFITEKPYQLIVEGETPISLEGTWGYKQGTIMPVAPSQTFIRWKPFGLYNGMIAPLLNYKIKGVLWYQGESNASRNPEDYSALMKTLIEDWRNRWQLGNFPFIFVQLANFMEAKDKPSESSWARLRQAQLETLVNPNTGMAVAIDLGEWNDIHPLNKQDIGRRLAREAEKLAYQQPKTLGSPRIQSVKKDGNKLILTFSEVGQGLISKDGKALRHFAIAGQNEAFVWAEAQIIAPNKVSVVASSIQNPLKVRYAWADNPSKVNLYNSENLPASPFEMKIKSK
jgi:sialate O-acetylesterase